MNQLSRQPARGFGPRDPEDLEDEEFDGEPAGVEGDEEGDEEEDGDEDEALEEEMPLERRGYE